VSIAIITDTVACLPADLANRLGIRVIPLQVIHKGVTYLDGVDMSAGRFYQILSTSEELPTTSAPVPEAYAAVYEELIEGGKEIMVICPSYRLTHVFESANIAARLIRERRPGAVISVIDSGTAAGAQGFVACEAARAVQAGANMAEVITVASDIMQKVCVIVFLDTLNYLVKGGRVPYIFGWANALLNIKPIIELKPLNKGVVPLARVRTRPGAMHKLIQVLKKRILNNPTDIVVHHTNCADEAMILEKDLKASLNCRNIYIKDFTPVMGLHTGPGLLGVAYFT
jgi:DegV family protein with EDD domain